MWNSYPEKSPNLRHCQAHSQNKGLSRCSQLWTSHPPPETGRRGQPELEAGNRSPREASSTKLHAGFVANQDFLGFWTVGILQEGCSQRSAPRRDTAHVRRHAGCTHRKLSGRDGGGDKSQPPPGSDCAHQASGHLSCSDLGRAQNAGPTKSVPLWHTQETELGWLRPGKCIQLRTRLRHVLAENPRA